MTQRHLPRPRRTRRLLWWTLATLAVVLTPGCSGCRRSGGPATQQAAQDDEQQSQRDKDKVKPKPNFEFGTLRVEPSESDRLSDSKINFVKPGHWVVAQQAMRANNFDFPGEVVSSAVDGSGRPFTLEATKFHFQTQRPIALTKGQTRLVETMFHVPWFSETKRNILFSSELKQPRGGQIDIGASGAVALPAHEFFVLVLSDSPEQYTYVKLLSAIDPPGKTEGNVEFRHYRVSSPKITRRIAAPSHSLAWTMIAYVVWDRVDTSLMSASQQDAMLDWLHWGGQLIISGPSNLDQLRSSFLGPYLPADFQQAVELGEEELAELNREWSLPSSEQRRLTLDVLGDAKLPGVRLQLRPEARVVDGTGGLVAERRVGRGRVVATAFALSDRRVRNWGSLDNFFNGALLRRPGRRFSVDELEYPVMSWSRLPSPLMIDPRLASSVRYLTRDIPDRGGDEGPDTVPDTRTVHSQTQQDDWRFRGAAYWRDAGVAAWNPRSGAAHAARRSLKRAAGIKVPEASFVLKAVSIYLLVLAPLNWLLFRVIGRVEWAWICAPLIAIAGAALVVKMAQLNIGFARSVTEVSVLEVHAGYDRAHLTRYTALYTSLATEFQMQLAEPSALAQPFSANLNYRVRLHDRLNTATLRREAEPALNGFQVASHNTGVLQCEQMLSLGGSLRLKSNGLEEPTLHNETDLHIRDAGVLRKLADGGLQAAWIGDLPPGQYALPFAVETPWQAQWEQSPQLSTRELASGELNLSEFAKLAAESMQLGPGETRLIGWLDRRFSGADVQPSGSQQRSAALVVAHLASETLPQCERDANLFIDFADNDDRVIVELPDDASRPETSNPETSDPETSSPDVRPGDVRP